MTPKAEKIVDFISDAINDLFFELHDKYPGLSINFVVEVAPGTADALDSSESEMREDATPLIERRY